jgi:hypothetical protein
MDPKLVQHYRTKTPAKPHFLRPEVNTVPVGARRRAIIGVIAILVAGLAIGAMAYVVAFI